jgi:excisionase family DNA binding protein
MNVSALVEREGLSISEACAMAGIGRTKIYQAINDGSLPARKCGKRTIILRSDVFRYLASLPVATTPNQSNKSTGAA